MRLRFFVVQDHKENRRKCTVEPLRGLGGIEIVRLPMPRPKEELLRVPAGILLDVEGPPLTRADSRLLGEDGRVVVLDATWARLASLRRRLEMPGNSLLRPRSVPGMLLTAYPRTSKLQEDPGAGLATVEALYATSVFLGEARIELLDHYRWREQFLGQNRAALADLDELTSSTVIEP